MISYTRDHGVAASFAYLNALQPGIFSPEDIARAVAAQKAGTNLTVDSFVKAMETTKFAPDMFGSPEASFAPNKRAGSDMTRMSQLQNERWKVVTDYVKAQ